MFSQCKALRAVTFPAGLKTIGAFAFADCLSLRQVVIPAGVEKIGRGAFAGCTALERVVLAGNPEIGPDAFATATVERLCGG